ncbi:hypothetical protein [Parafrankia soli]|uniref:hypothetical protein n=1 Tax=Parafrankia soli TaxID=2599596 RepID=UPI003B588F60
MDEVRVLPSDRGERDVLVTGMGFCLPGESRPVLTPEEVWDVASNGRSCRVCCVDEVRCLDDLYQA